MAVSSRREVMIWIYFSLRGRDGSWHERSGGDAAKIGCAGSIEVMIEFSTGAPGHVTEQIACVIDGINGRVVDDRKLTGLNGLRSALYSCQSLSRLPIQCSIRSVSRLSSAQLQAGSAISKASRIARSWLDIEGIARPNVVRTGNVNEWPKLGRRT